MSLIPHYQPIMNLESQSVFGYEVTVRGYIQGRWIRADTIIKQMTAHNVIPQFDHTVHSAALENPPDADVLFLNCEFATLATNKLMFPSDADLHRIVLEINERDAIHDNFVEIEQTLAPFRQKGMRIAIDDFGTGWSNFRNVASLAPEFIKLDKSMMENVLMHTKLSTFFTGLRKFSNEIDAKIIAEGIETEEQHHFLVEHQIPYAQGYFYDVPRPSGSVQMNEHERKDITQPS